MEDGLELVRGTQYHPFAGANPLRVELLVDANHADNWYNAK